MQHEVNNALGLAQYLTQHRGVEAVSYLLAIENLSLDDWKVAKEKLAAAVQTNRHHKEGHIKDIVNCFVNNVINTRYLVENLALVPGFQPKALELVSYTAGTLCAVRHFADRIVAQSDKQGESTSSQHNLRTVPSQGKIAVTEIPDNNCNRTVDKQKQTSSTQLSSKIGKSNTISYRDAVNKIPANNFTKSKKANYQKKINWTHGKNQSETESLTPQLKFKCICVKSGPSETVETLRNEINKIWTNLRDLKVEAYAATTYHTVFRVQFDIPAALQNEITNEKSWPTRISVRPWRGSPKVQLKPLDQRQTTKKIYIGNLTESMTMNKLVSNMKQIYAKEIRDEIIHNIDAYLNTSSWKIQNKLHTENPQHQRRKSACVVITSTQGKSLDEIDLKQEQFPVNMRRSVRPWNGPVPFPRSTNNAPEEIPLNLSW